MVGLVLALKPILSVLKEQVILLGEVVDLRRLENDRIFGSLAEVLWIHVGICMFSVYNLLMVEVLDSS